MRDWNVVATAHDAGFRRACELLSLGGGPLSRTGFYNVVVMKVPDVERFLQWLAKQWSASHHFADVVAHVRPARQTFDFESPEEFEAKSRDVARGNASRLAGEGFFVRVHLRGFKGSVSAKQVERFLGETLLGAGSPAESGRITFEDPDAILALDTVGDRAGASLWSRDDLRRYSFLGLL